MIYVVGSLNLDYVARLEHLPRPGETVLGSVLEKTPGGKGANQALAARRAGADVRLIGCVGDDDDARLATALLVEAGVDLSGIAKCKTTTGVALIEIDAAGENSIAVLPGANMDVTVSMVEAGLAQLDLQDLVILQQEIPQAATQVAIARARKAGALSILNIAPILADSAALASQADIVIANETEFRCISGGEANRAEAEAWCQKTGRELVLTLGAEGAIFIGQGQSLHQPAPKITPVDTVGAGDTFVGYFAAGLHAQLPVEDALKMAVAASAQACLKAGAQAAIPCADQM